MTTVNDIKLPEGYLLIKETEYRELLLKITALSAIDEKLTKQNEELLAKIKELEARLNKDSNNSSKPPSSDGFRKVVKNSREKSGKKPGAQPGHTGSYLKAFDEIDQVIDVPVVGKCECGIDLTVLPVERIERRTVLDLPEKLYSVTEYQVEIKSCNCGRHHEGVLPYHNSRQYGERLKAFLVYLNVQHQIPYNRIQEFTKEIFGFTISDGLLSSSIEQCSRTLLKYEDHLIMQLLKAGVLHSDESGLRCIGKTLWAHVASTLYYTFYRVHEKRGKEAMDAIGILPAYTGTLVHDRWASYDMYERCTHSICNAHLQRELKYLNEELGITWAGSLRSILCQANEYKTNNNEVSLAYYQEVKEKIAHIIEEPLKIEESAFMTEAAIFKKRGKKKKSKALLYLQLFRDRLDEILRFLSDPKVPFDNNQAERDIRPVKLKQKISGSFRSIKGVNAFCIIRGYISTAKKQGEEIWNALLAAIRGTPLYLLANSS